MKTSIDRLLDFLGTAAGGVVVMTGAGVVLPGWLVIAAGVIAYAAGKASPQGLPFMGKKAAPDPIPPDQRKPGAA